MTGNRLPRNGFTLAETLVTLGIFMMVVVAISNIYLLYNRAQRQTLTREKMVAEASILLDELARQVRTREIIYYGQFDYDGPGTNASANTQLYFKDGDGGPDLPTTFISGSEIELALLDPVGETLVYLFNPPSANPAVGTFNYCTNPGLPGVDPPGLYLYSKSATGVLNCNRLFSIPNVTMDDLKFYITPSYNPYPDSDADCGNGEDLMSSYNGSYCECRGACDCSFPVACPPTISCSDHRCHFPDQQPRVTIALKIRDGRFPATPITLQTTVSSRIYKR